MVRTRQLRISIGFWLLLALFTAGASPAVAQFDQLLKGGASSQPPPAGVERRGLLEAADVTLDGQTLFKVAAPAVLDRSKPSGLVPVENRASQINTTLAQLTGKDALLDPNVNRPYTTVLDPETSQVFTQSLNGQPVLFVKDAHRTEPRVLLTVTDADAQYYATDRSALTTRWELELDEEVNKALVARLPGTERRQYTKVAQFLAAAILLSLLLGLVWRLLERRRKSLKRRFETQAAEEARVEAAATSDGDVVPEQTHAPQIVAFLREHLGLRQRLQIIIFLRWLLLWLLVFVWAIGISASLYQFPETRVYSRTLASTPIVILIAWFAAGLINGLTNLGLDQLARVWETNARTYGAAAGDARRAQRIPTIIGVLNGLKASVIYIVAVIWVLQRLKFAPASLIALGAVVALAISFAAQSLVKDLVNGLLILLEDQFAIGDIITTGAATGVVENMNLRITQVRSDDGRLITIPNSLIAQVENHTRIWSRVNLVIRVAYQTDVDKALAVVRRVAEEMARDPAWVHLIVNPKELLGVDAISSEGVSIRIWVRTAPGKQGPVARELRRRLKIAFDASGIQIGIPLSQAVPANKPAAESGAQPDGGSARTP